MKKTNILSIFICLMLIFLFPGCETVSHNSEHSEVTMSNYYRKEDFQSITIGETTYYDVYKVASSETMNVTSYGGFCKYPIQGGGYILIKFYGKDLIVGAIEEVNPDKE